MWVARLLILRMRSGRKSRFGFPAPAPGHSRIPLPWKGAHLEEHLHEDRFHRARQRRREARRKPVAQRLRPHGARPGPRRRTSSSRSRRGLGRIARLDGTCGGPDHHLPAQSGHERGGNGSRRRHSRRHPAGRDMGRDEHERRSGGETPRRPGLIERRGAARLPGVRRMPSRRHRQHLDICRRRARCLRSHPAPRSPPWDGAFCTLADSAPPRCSRW